MVGWQRSLQTIIRHVGKRVEQKFGASITFSGAHISSSGQSYYPCNTYSSTKIQHPFNQFLQQLGISSSRNLLTDSTHAIPSPLTPVLSIESGKTENQAAVAKPSKVQAILKNIKQSPKKVNLVAALVRGMRVEDALLQLQVTVKRASKTVYQVIHSARANATHNHGLDPDRLLIAEAFVGKGCFLKRVSYHSKGRHGIKERPECRLTVVVREMTPKEEAEVARLRVSNFRKLTKRERRLVPHQLIETTPVWNRKGKRGDQLATAMA
ncbi:50S ribosomal protein L22 [Thalictrum thalictroides]|uniref:Large ribosomal subunit protein uL22c n=1 Tax=Thalictrum thalictroides TaxID=46969 RepID=A0A7J6XF27_THATH|nr:50S ribosomal protein L22 [Thalictrum thalictroides]